MSWCKVWAAVAPEEAQQSNGSYRRLAGGSVVVDLIVQGQKHECRTLAAAGVFTGEAKHNIEVVHVDPAWEVYRQQSIFAQYPDIENYTEGAGAHQLGDKELAEVAYLTRRDYRVARLYEVETMGEIFPFFEVTYSDDHYDSRTMGAGELAAFMLWWIARRAADRSILLIEEPETFLSPASQEAGVRTLLQWLAERSCAWS